VTGPEWQVSRLDPGAVAVVSDPISTTEGGGVVGSHNHHTQIRHCILQATTEIYQMRARESLLDSVLYIKDCSKRTGKILMKNQERSCWHLGKIYYVIFIMIINSNSGISKSRSLLHHWSRP
jgi:hypothetical protein